MSPFSAAFLVPKQRGDPFPWLSCLWPPADHRHCEQVVSQASTPALPPTSVSSSPPPLFDQESLFHCSSIPLSQIPSTCLPYPVIQIFSASLISRQSTSLPGCLLPPVSTIVPTSFSHNFSKYTAFSIPFSSSRHT